MMFDKVENVVWNGKNASKQTILSGSKKDKSICTFLSWKGQKVKVLLSNLTNLCHMSCVATWNVYRMIPPVASCLQQSHILHNYLPLQNIKNTHSHTIKIFLENLTFKDKNPTKKTTNNN